MLFQVEEWGDIKHEMVPLVAKHWEECNHDPKEYFNIDEAQYDTLAQVKMFLIVTLRHEGVLIGYVANSLMSNINAKHVLCAFELGWYLQPQYRKGGLGVKLLLETEIALKNKGVQKMYAAIPPGSRASIILDRLQWTEVEHHYSKWIGE